jgi:hypothetical protein
MKIITALLFGFFSGVIVAVLNASNVEMAVLGRQFVLIASLGAAFMYAFLEVFKPSKLH